MEKNKSLPELIADLSSLMNQLIESGGEFSDELEINLDTVKNDIILKTDSYIYLLDRAEHEEEFLKQRADKIYKAQKAVSNFRKRLNETIKQAAIILGTSEIKGSEFKFKLTRCAPKLVIDERALPDSYKMEVRELIPDKEKIKSDIEAGKTIRGVTQEDVFSLKKYVSK